jgi:sugar phosphate isomerase/epimerase
MPELIEEFAGYGFDAFSFSRQMLTDADPKEVSDAAGLLRRRGYAATLHSDFNLTPDMTGRLLKLLGESLCCITFDRVSTEISSGSRYDIGRMQPVLADVAEQTRGTGVRFGVEDFPLDAAALESCREGLRPFLCDERFGTLIDLGHLNHRIRGVDYWRGMTVEDYLAAVPAPIIEIHVHDNKGDRDSHAPIGWGNCDFAAMAGGLRSAGFEGVSTIEVGPRIYGSTPGEARGAASESLRAWRAVWSAAGEDY